MSAWLRDRPRIPLMVIVGNFKTYLETPGSRPENTASKFITPRGTRTSPMTEYNFALSEGMIMESQHSFATAMMMHENICSSQVLRQSVNICVSFILKCTARLSIFPQKSAASLNTPFCSFVKLFCGGKDYIHPRTISHSHLII